MIKRLMSKWKGMERPVKAMYIAIAIGVAVAFLALVVDIVYVHIIQAAVFGYVLGVGYTYKCLSRKWDKVIRTQELALNTLSLSKKTSQLSQSFDDLLSIFGEQEEEKDTVH